MRNEYFDPSASAVLEAAAAAVGELKQSDLGSEHLLIGLLSCPDTLSFDVLTDFELSADAIKEKLSALSFPQEQRADNLIRITPRAERILKVAIAEAQSQGRRNASDEDILSALLKDREGLAVKLMQSLGVEAREVLQALNEARANASKAPKSAAKNSKTPTLDKYGRDLTALARDGKLDPIIGRGDELNRVTQILSRRTKNNPCLIGEPGVGKTAVVEGLAQKIVARDVPEILENRRVVTLDLTGMLAGSKYRGEFEERIKGVIDEVTKARDVILFIDEIHVLIGAGGAEGAIDAANILKPALARGELQVIGATTLNEYRNIEKDAALERRFQPVIVNEPSEEETIAILEGLKEKYEAHHGIKITPEAIRAAVRLSTRYIGDRFLPDKAIDLIDEAQSKLKIRHMTLPEDLKAKEATLNDLKKKKAQAVKAEEYEQAQSLLEGEKKLKDEIDAAKEAWRAHANENLPAVGEDDIAEIVTEWTKIPVKKLMAEEADRLVHLEDLLKKRVIGQDEAVEAVARAIRRARSGLKDPRRPTGSFIFAGPTGVGKTELSKALAELLFGDESKLIRVDMSEFMEKHSVSKLIGSPPGYVGYDEGGELTEKVRRNPYSVILFDEIEKAHPDVFHILLQILDDGLLTDSHGRHVNFKNTIVIMTSNAGASELSAMARTGFLSEEPKNKDLKKQSAEDEKSVNEALKRLFRPEFLNRVDEIIVFKRLEQESIEKITKILLSSLEARLKEQGFSLKLDDSAVKYLAREGFDPEYGARPLRRAIQRKVEDSLALDILDGKFVSGDTIRVSAKDDKIRFSKA